MNECFGRKFILNGKLQTSDMFDNSLVYEGESVYEVIRMERGSPVFFQDHMERLGSSLVHQHRKPLADYKRLRNDIITLVKTEKRREINLKIVFNYRKDMENYLVYFVEPIYPSEEQYRKGVKGILYHAERKTPGSKVINHKLRSSIYHRLILEGAYEALLVNEDSCITEGSRSNIFFLKGEVLTTAPEKKVLGGITRKYIIEICRERNISVDYRCVPSDTIGNFDAVFMTGTSPMVLPFCCIDDVRFRVDIPVIADLRRLYSEKADESIQLFISGGQDQSSV
ncbi:MAG TPA: aminotransferase class IV [Bacteroidales bacterium]|nr:aminotransferase class IV [Bacteroidales bacterium]